MDRRWPEDQCCGEGKHVGKIGFGGKQHMGELVMDKQVKPQWPGNGEIIDRWWQGRWAEWVIRTAIADRLEGLTSEG